MCESQLGYRILFPNVFLVQLMNLGQSFSYGHNLLVMHPVQVLLKQKHGSYLCGSLLDTCFGKTIILYLANTVALN